MENLEKLETAVSKKVEQWNVEDLGKISSDEKLRTLLIEPDVLNECINRSQKNKEIEDILVPLSIKIIINDSTKTVSDVGNKYIAKELSLNEFEEQIKKLLGGSVYQRMLVYYLIITLIPDKCKDYETQIKEDCLDIKEKIIALMSDQDLILVNFEIVNNLLDLLYPLRVKYFQIYERDLLDDASEKELEFVITTLNSITEQIQKSLMEFGKMNLNIEEDKNKNE